jgi:hypothetical protein
MGEFPQRQWVGKWDRIPDIVVKIDARTRGEAKWILSRMISNVWPKPDWRELHVRLDHTTTEAVRGEAVSFSTWS